MYFDVQFTGTCRLIDFISLATILNVKKTARLVK